jgi:hypothetical protein
MKLSHFVGLNKIFGSLVLGGYDAARFTKPSSTSPDLTFPFYTDIARDLLVGISSIETSNSTSSTSSTKLLKDGIFAFIDSTIPHLWLPESVCEAFESAFGIVWNSTTELYMLSSTQHSTLSKLNPSITITLSPTIPASSTDKTVSINLPYSAFNLNLSWPYSEQSRYYFPLKRATNDTQYTLGRAFLQEAYLIADYERNNFSVWPCSWDSNTNNARVVAIRSVNDTADSHDSPGINHDTDSGKNKGLATGTVAGIAVVAAVSAIAALVAVYFWLRKKRRTKRTSFELGVSSTDPMDPMGSAPAYHPHKEILPEELDSAAQHELPGEHKFGVLEVPDGSKYEMDGTGTPAEVPGNEHKLPSNAVYEMDACEQISPHVFVQPPKPSTGAVLPSPLPTRGKTEAVDGSEKEKRLGHEPERDAIRMKLIDNDT